MPGGATPLRNGGLPMDPYTCDSQAMTIALRGPSATRSVEAQDARSVAELDTVYGVFHVTHAMSEAQQAIMRSMADFFDKKRLQEVLIPLITQESPVSLRVLDFLVTSYAKTRLLAIRAESEVVFVHEQYKQRLLQHRRRNFDPFRRMQRTVGTEVARYCVWFLDDSGQRVESTVGQLNFVAWALSSGVLSYAEGNLPAIVQAMNQHRERAGPAPACAVFAEPTVYSMESSSLASSSAQDGASSACSKPPEA